MPEHYHNWISYELQNVTICNNLSRVVWAACGQCMLGKHSTHFVTICCNLLQMGSQWNDIDFVTICYNLLQFYSTKFKCRSVPTHYNNRSSRILKSYSFIVVECLELTTLPRGASSKCGSPPTYNHNQCLGKYKRIQMGTAPCARRWGRLMCPLFFRRGTPAKRKWAH